MHDGVPYLEKFLIIIVIEKQMIDVPGIGFPGTGNLALAEFPEPRQVSLRIVNRLVETHQRLIAPEYIE
jgi:hypothetical protein